jgi:two-component system NtrC family sensor kinase
MSANLHRRVLVIDDMASIQQDFAKALTTPKRDDLTDIETGLFGPQLSTAVDEVHFELSFASQGLEGVERAREALSEGRPYALAFVDIRMPPGLDGIETILQLWDVDPRLEIVICTAYSDYSWAQMLERLARTAQFLVLTKPFDSTVVKQLALGLTEKWKLARAVEQSSAQLESLVVDRTRELSRVNEELKLESHERSRLERRVQHSQKLEALGRLVAGVAHEINNPLTVILANVDHLKGELEAMSDKIGTRVESLLAVNAETNVGGKRIQRIVKDLRAFSQTEERRAEPVDLRATMDFALRMASASFPPSLEVISHCDDALPSVTGSPGQLLQVLLHLVINATQAMASVPVARRKLGVTIRRGDAERVVITVSDQGVGISPQDLQKVFEPFFTTRNFGTGTGLGLSVCHGFIKEMGGEISIESKVGEGTIVTVTLPTRPPAFAVADPSSLGSGIPSAAALARVS